MPDLHRQPPKNYGQFMPVDRINSTTETPKVLQNSSSKRREQIEQPPHSTPPKRRRIELSPSMTPRSARTAEAGWTRSPSPKGRPSSSNLSATSNRIASSTVAELRLVDTSTRIQSRRRRRRHGRGGEDAFSAITLPRGIIVDDVDKDENGDEDGESAVEVVSSSKAAPNHRNTNLTIEIRDSYPRNRIRDRMMDRLPKNAALSRPWQPPAEAQPGGVKRTIHNSSRSGNESADELSKEYFFDRRSRKTSKSPAQGIRVAEEKRVNAPDLPAAKMSVSSFVQSLIDVPLQVSAAFCYPSHSFVSSAISEEGNLSMTVDPQLSYVVRPTDASSARNEKLSWLKCSLVRTNALKYNKLSPVVLFDISQRGQLKDGQLEDGRLGPLMGIRFKKVKDAARLIAWAANCSNYVRLVEVQADKVWRAFDNALNTAKEAGQKPVPNDSVDVLSLDANDKPLTGQISGALSSPLDESQEKTIIATAVMSSPTQKSTEEPVIRATRQRASLGAAETVDLEDPALGGDLNSCLENRRSSRNKLSQFGTGTAEFGLEPVKRWTEENPDWAKDWRIPLTYSRTTVDKDDVARLDEGEFLNDNVINFYLQFLQNTLKRGESNLAKRVYFHNTFFYEKLKPKKGRAISFDGVRRWTAKIDLFSYDYIVVPVNEHSHWWVAIMSNVPKLVAESMPKDESEPDVPEDADAAAIPDAGAKSDPPTSVTVDDEQAECREKGTETATGGTEEGGASEDVMPESKDKTTNTVRLGDGNEADGNGNDDDDNSDDDEVTEIKSDIIAVPPRRTAFKKLSKGQVRKLFMKKTKSQDPKAARIVTLDSLGSPHSVSIDHLKQWLLAEMEERKGIKPSHAAGLGMTAKTIPQQENFCDCGVYLLLYVQEFVKDPDGFMEDMVLHNERQWDTSAPEMRRQLRDLILQMQKEYQAAEEQAKQARRRNGQNAATAAARTKAAAKATMDMAVNTAAADANAIVGGSPPGEQSSSPCISTSPPRADMTTAANLSATAAPADGKEAGWLCQKPGDRPGSSASSSIGPAEAGKRAAATEDLPSQLSEERPESEEVDLVQESFAEEPERFLGQEAWKDDDVVLIGSRPCSFARRTDFAADTTTAEQLTSTDEQLSFLRDKFDLPVERCLGFVSSRHVVPSEAVYNYKRLACVNGSEDYGSDLDLGGLD
ncbi:ulp1 protease family protein [Grosmannia clavigera kw1407]|uniref:Ulp1 protease family protein n=1 Tax=Grosmannia clavigera (strain kw1407 / UAMH 11150) TaxID=655863 RepID=F0XG59_GROCL|nr:ulp1 protease family protein [Grosmannia clavigera kw1407]EFX02853.1 ulp1 protease family protein [Grosmannia clavigera kw1407]